MVIVSAVRSNSFGAVGFLKVRPMHVTAFGRNAFRFCVPGRSAARNLAVCLSPFKPSFALSGGGGDRLLLGS